jgi:hypothetical protein
VLIEPGVSDINVSRYLVYTYVVLSHAVAKRPTLRVQVSLPTPYKTSSNLSKNLLHRIRSMRRPRISEVQKLIKSALKRVQRLLNGALTMMLCTFSDATTSVWSGGRLAGTRIVA